MAKERIENGLHDVEINGTKWRVHIYGGEYPVDTFNGKVFEGLRGCNNDIVSENWLFMYPFERTRFTRIRFKLLD